MLRKITGVLSLFVLVCVIGIKAQGWPANYGGVMLQGFYWDSYTDTKWTNLEKQADELSKYFDLIWIPNSANSDGGMGYMPVYWFTNYSSAFGNEKELRSMIETYAAKGTGFIADVVVNHRNGYMSWYKFPKEVYNGVTYEMADGSIVANDNVWAHPESGCPQSYKGNYDTGDLFDGCRDLDHTNTTVQNHIKAYTAFLLNDLGYIGFRYDMVKGYDGQYTKIYNNSSKPKFSVGEFWDSSYDEVAKWIDKTGKTSAAFDFPCKYQINSAFHGNDMTALVWNANYVTPQPAGMIHYGYQQYAVTFVDNHDTARENNDARFHGNVPAANAFILCSPGTPCVFLPHYNSYKKEIQRLIDVRKSVGVHNMSAVNVLQTDKSCYMAEVTGTKGKLVVKIGSAQVSPSGYTADDIVASGNDYCIWTKTKIEESQSGDPIEPNPGTTPSGDITIYYDNSNTGFSPVNCHYFGTNGESNWPGVAMQQVSRASTQIYEVKIPAGSSVVFNSGQDKPQTVDIPDVKHGYLYTGSGNKVEEDGNADYGKYLADIKGVIYDAENDYSGNDGLFLLGDFNGNSWDPYTSQKFSVEDELFVITADFNSTSGSTYFSFATRRGSWDEVNVGPRYSTSADGTEPSLESDNAMTKYSNTGDVPAWKIANGVYTLTVDLGTMTFTIVEDIIVDPEPETPEIPEGDNSGTGAVETVKLSAYDITAGYGDISIGGLNGENLVVAGIDGRVYYQDIASGSVTLHLGRGIYLVKINGEAIKLVVK